MKDLEPNPADVRATLQINFAISMMYSMPLALVGMHIALLEASYLDISVCYLVAMAMASIAAAVMSCVDIRSPLPIILTALILGLFSAIALVDFQEIDDQSTREEIIERAKHKFMVSLAIGGVGYTLGIIGLKVQLNQLVPRKLYLLHSQKLYLG